MTNKLNISPHDRIQIDQQDYEWVSSNHAGYILRKKDSVINQGFTYDAISELIQQNRLRIDRKYHTEGSARSRQLSDVNSLAELPSDEVGHVMRRKYYLDEFLRLEACDKTNVKRTDDSIVATLKLIDRERWMRKTRCDQPTICHPAPSPRTFRRWLRAYERGTFDALSLRTKFRLCGDRDSHLHPLAEHVLRSFAASYADERRPSVVKVHDSMKLEFIKINTERKEQGLPELSCPSINILRTRIRQRPAFETYAGRHGLAAARAKFAIVGAGADVTRPLQLVQIDEWVMQAHTIVDSLGPGERLTEKQRLALTKERLRICVVMDVATRCVLAVRVSRKADNTTAIAALAMAVADKTKIAKAAGCASDWPMAGAFSLISPDAGAAFIDENFRACVAAMKATYENAPAGMSWLRGHIERTFRTMDTRLLQELPGRTFGNIVEKGEYNSENRAAVLSADIPAMFVRHIVDIYHHTPHAGLGGETPYACWVRLVALFGIDAPPSPDQRREIFGTDLKKTLDSRGIRVANIFYQSAELQEWRRHVGDTKVRVRFDGLDLGWVSVWVNSKWITVPAVHLETFRGVELQTWSSAVADLKRRYARAAKLSEQIVYGAIRSIQNMVAQSMHRVSLDATTPTPAEFRAIEAQLGVGFEIVEASNNQDSSATENPLDGGYTVTGPSDVLDSPLVDELPPLDGEFKLED